MLSPGHDNREGQSFKRVLGNIQTMPAEELQALFSDLMGDDELDKLVHKKLAAYDSALTSRVCVTTQNQELDAITGVAYVPSPMAMSPEKPGGNMKVPRSIFAPSPGQQAEQQTNQVEHLKKELKQAEQREVAPLPIFYPQEMTVPTLTAAPPRAHSDKRVVHFATK